MAGLLADLAVGQPRLQFGAACVGDLPTKRQPEHLQLGQPLEVHKPSVGDQGGHEIEFNDSTLVILRDLGSQFLERGNRIDVIDLCRRGINSVCWSRR